MNDLHKNIPRLQTPHLKRVLGDFPVVVLQGARQTGKTTLAQMPDIGGTRSYLSLDDLDVREQARRAPSSLFIGRQQITLDEVQRQPDILLAIKSDVDRTKKPGRFLLTGSANLLLMKHVSESLAGRAVYFYLPTLTWAELEQRSFGAGLDLLLSVKTAEKALAGLRGDVSKPVRPLGGAVFCGGYPVPSLSKDDAFRARWFDGYIQTYLERDLRTLTATENLIEFRRLMQLCAARNARTLNIASLAHDAALSTATVRRYLSILEISFQIARIPAYSVNRGKRLIKASKLYWTDTGLAAHLAGIFTRESLVKAHEFGLWVENWVAVHLLAYVSLTTPRAALYHWRTSNGEEVDFVLEQGRRLVPIEVKTTEQPTGRDIKGLESFLTTYPEAPFGVLACRCRAPSALSGNIIALPIEHLLLT